MNAKDINIQEVEQYTTLLYHTHQTPDLLYHNLDHTLKVMLRIQEIAGNFKLSEQDRFVLYTAGWMHDTGHLFGPAEAHEARSVDIMSAYLLRLEIPVEVIDQVADCILATTFPATPKSLLAAILCDADLFHLGTDEFEETDPLVKKETELRTHQKSIHWDAATLKFLRKHQYFTPYCKTLLAQGKLKNIQRLETKINQAGNY